MPFNRFWNLLAKKLSGEALPDELQELEKLMKEHPNLTYSAEQLENFWKQSTIKPDDYDAELAFEIHLNKLKEAGIKIPELEAPVRIVAFDEQKKRPAFRRRILTYAIAACFILVAFLIWRNNSGSELQIPEKNFSEVSTRLGSKTKLVLPDSSVVWLNAGSKLTYSENFGTTNRNTTLSGEAFFEVKKGTIPFVIHANTVQIKVLGTSFNVKSYPNEKTTETSLVRGKVEITLDKRPGEKFILNPNEKLIVTNGHEETKLSPAAKEPIVVLSALTHTTDNTIVETSWVENKLVFQDESFMDLAKKMERWYGVNIEIRNEKIAGERLTGTFTTETIQEALEELQMISPFHFTIKSNSILITK